MPQLVFLVHDEDCLLKGKIHRLDAPVNVSVLFEKTCHFEGL